MKAGVVALIGKVVDAITKFIPSGEKKQELAGKKVELYSKIIIIVTLVALLMCSLDSLFPGLAITSYWYDLLDKLINSIATS